MAKYWDLLPAFPSPTHSSPIISRKFFAHLPVLETPRLTLRPLTMHDAADIFAYSCDPEVARYVLWNAHRSLGDSRDYLRFVLRQYRNGEPSVWGIVSKDSGRVIGTIGYMAYVWENLPVEVGYSLARSHWNRGLMTEALQAVIDATFQNIYIHRIEAQHDVRNPASGRVMARCGMQYEGLLRDRVFNKNHFVDISLYAILYDDWKKARQAKTNVPPGSA